MPTIPIQKGIVGGSEKVKRIDETKTADETGSFQRRVKADSVAKAAAAAPAAPAGP